MTKEVEAKAEAKRQRRQLRNLRNQEADIAGQKRSLEALKEYEFIRTHYDCRWYVLVSYEFLYQRS